MVILADGRLPTPSSHTTFPRAVVTCTDFDTQEQAVASI